MEVEEKQKTGLILNIQRMSTEDGLGIRTTVFMKGCPLSCKWCHNPESISPLPQVQWVEIKCIGCGTCVEECPEKALSRTEKEIGINRIKCIGCGVCAEKCPSGAMELFGKKWNTGDLLNVVLKDRAYYEKSNGGVTLSGGDPLFQWEFTASFLKLCKENGLNTALDTSGMSAFSVLEKIIPYTDIILYDIKEIDAQKHKMYTGQSNEYILNNLVLIKEYMKIHKTPNTLWIRTPLIPDTTADEENIREIGKFIAENLEGRISRWELCAFNNLCRDKYRRLGMDWQFRNHKLLTRDFVENLVSAAKNSGVNPGIVFWTGALESE